MVSHTQQPLAKDNQFCNATRPARALLGWMARNEAELALAQRRVNAVTPEHSQRVARAQAVVAARSPGIDQTNLISDIPKPLKAHVAQLQAHAAFAPIVAEGWTVKLADLTKVCALQSTTLCDGASERVKGATPNDMAALIAVTLPVPQPLELPLHFDPVNNVWTIALRNPNLQIVGHFAGPVQDHIGCGFLIAVSPSFVQVALYRGRYVLRDGYHRCLALLAKGIKKAPVLFREYTQFESLNADPALFPEAVYLGERPPLLPDYLNEEVSAEVQLAASRKMIVIPGLEMSQLG